MEISLNSRAPHLTYNRKSVTFTFADSTGAVCGQNAPVPAVQAGQKYHFAPVLFYPGYNFNTFSYTKQWKLLLSEVFSQLKIYQYAFAAGTPSQIPPARRVYPEDPQPHANKYHFNCYHFTT